MPFTMQIAVSLQSMFTTAPFPERFARARAAGFGRVEVGDWTGLDLSLVKRELARNSLRLDALDGADNFSLVSPEAREPFLEYLSQSVAVAKSFDCRNLVIQSADDDSFGESDDGDSGHDATSPDFSGRAAAAQTLMLAAEKAARAGVTLLLKPAFLSGDAFSYLHTNSSAGSLVKVINSPALRLLFTFSLTHPIEDSVAATFNKYKQYIGRVHIGEASLRVVRAVLLNELRYDGAVGLVFGTGDTEEEERANLEEIRESFGDQLSG